MKKSVKTTAFVCLLSLGMLAAACGKKDDGKSSQNIPESSLPASESEAHVHAFGEWETVKEATHTEEGEKKRTCACGEVETEKIAKTTAHEFGAWVETKAATHTEEGSEERTCACGESETRTVAKTTAHSFGEWKVVKAATHTAEGSEERTCACGEKETRTIAKTTAHEFGAWTTRTSETCTAAEVLERTCACGESETKNGKPATGHDLFSDWRMDDTHHWHACKYDATEQLEKAEHVYDKEVATDEYRVSDPLPYIGAVYHSSCVCGKAGGTNFHDNDYEKVTSYTWVKEPTVEDFGIIKCSYAKSADYSYQIPELGNTNFWEVGEEVEIPGGKTRTYTYKTKNGAALPLLETNNWCKKNYDSTITPFIQNYLLNVLRYACTSTGTFANTGLSYTLTTMNPVEAVFANGYCAATGEETFRFVVEDVMTITEKGTLLSGTVLGAPVSVGDKVTYYEYGTERTVEYTISRIEAFQKALETAQPGTNVGIYFEENPERSTVTKGSLIADPAGNWTKTSSVTGTLFLNNERHTPISNGYRPQIAWNVLGDTAQLAFPSDVEMIMPGEKCENMTASILIPQYLFGGVGEYVVTEGGKKIGYFVIGDSADKVEWNAPITVQAKSKGTDTATSKYTVTAGHFAAEDGKTYEDPLMKKALTVKKYDLFVGVTGSGVITGRGTYLTCAPNGLYEKDASGWNASGSAEVNTGYNGKIATIEFVDAEGVLTTSQHVITGAEKRDGTYSFLMRNLDKDAALTAVRMYVEA